MAPQTGTAILVLVVFVLPGFIALRYAEQTYRTRAEDSTLERVLTALYFSVLSYVVVAAGAMLLFDAERRDVRQLWHGQKPLATYLGLTVAGILMPIAIAELARRWTKTRRLRPWILRWLRISPVHRVPSGWEHFFERDRWAFVRATLKDGRVVGGFFGTNSFAGYTADTPDLYLEQRYELDDKDWFVNPAPGTLGVYVRADEIVSVEFYDAGGPTDGAAPRLSFWRRLLSRMSRDATQSGEPASGSSQATTADPQERGDLALGSGAEATQPPEPSDGLGHVGPTVEE